MAIQVNPFQVHIDRGESRTLAEIEASSNGFSTLHSLAARPGPGQAKVSEWLLRQKGYPNDEDFVEVVDGPNRPQRSRESTPFSRKAGDQPATQGPRDKAAHPGTFATPSRPATRTAPSSQDPPCRGQKRKVTSFNDSEDDVIIVRTRPIYSGRVPQTTAEVVDLTEGSSPKRRSSFFGNQDDDVIIIDPPAAEIRRDLRSLLHERRGSRPTTRIQSRKRPRQSHTEPKPATARQVRVETQDSLSQTVEPEESTAEASALLQSIESVTHFFTLAVEIRDKIYRHLLVSPNPIRVQRLWTEPVRSLARRRGNAGDLGIKLETGILAVCRQTAAEATRILYSENCFLYLLRDPEVVSKGILGAQRRSQRTAATNVWEDQKKRGTIHLAKYGHLIRQLAIVVEPNRTGPEYEKLMVAALEALSPEPDGAGLCRPPSPFRSLCGDIHLHTLTITVSPRPEPSYRSGRAPTVGGQGAANSGCHFLSTVAFFDRRSAVLRALRRINADFLRINVHVNPSSPAGGGQSGDESDVDADFDDLSSADATRPETRHLEATIDLRCLPRQVEDARSRWGPLQDLWANDALMQEKRRQQGAKAEETLLNLRRHIEEACLRPWLAVRRGGVWEEYRIAERRRREKRDKEEALFDADAYTYTSRVDSESDVARATRGMRSLILFIDRVGGELRAYRG